MEKGHVVMWSDEVMHPSRIVPTEQACGGSAMIWGFCSWSGLGSAKWCAQWMTRLFHQWFFSLTSLGCSGEGFVQWSDSPVIKTRSWWKMNATLDGNKSCDIAEAYLNNATVNACRNKSVRLSNNMIECVTFFLVATFSLGRQFILKVRSTANHSIIQAK